MTSRSNRPVGSYLSINRSSDSHSRTVKRPQKAVSVPSGRRRVRSPYGQPPVLVRNETSALPIDNRKRRKTRRRYDVALGSHGAELRLPSLPQVHFGWRLVSFLLVAVLAGAIYAVWTAPEFKVGTVEINGLVRLTKEDIQTVLNLEGQPVFTVSPSNIKEDLAEAFPEIADISVTVGLPASVSVTLEERQPVLALRLGEEELWVDGDGVSFPPRGDSGPLPVIEGEEIATLVSSEGSQGGTRYDPKMIQAVLALSSYVPPGRSLVFDEQHGMGWSDERGWQVYFGKNLADAGEIEMKLRVYDALVQRLDENGIWPQFISVEFLHAPYYRLE
jgi:cell division protein FtsQ